jgi:hypothetical protein
VSRRPGLDRGADRPFMAYTRAVSTAAWELVFMMLVLKLPIAYLCAVVWWAIRAEPEQFEHAALVPANEPDPGGEPCPWRRPSPRPRGPVRARVRRARRARVGAL